MEYRLRRMQKQPLMQLPGYHAASKDAVAHEMHCGTVRQLAAIGERP